MQPQRDARAGCEGSSLGEWPTTHPQLLTAEALPTDQRQKPSEVSSMSLAPDAAIARYWQQGMPTTAEATCLSLPRRDRGLQSPASPT